MSKLAEPHRSKVLTYDRSGKILYAVVYVHRWKGRTRTGTEYMHAENQSHAEGMFMAAHGMPGKVQIIEAAPVVGFEVLDNHGDWLTV